MKHFKFLTSLLPILAVLVATDGLAEAGRISEGNGTIFVERKSKIVNVTSGAEIQSGDVLITGTNSTMGVKMVNGEEIYLRPNTRFSVDQFVAPQSIAKPGTGRSFYSLLRGGFRAVTKSLGQRGIDSYRINTPVATIGVRGSIVIGALGSAGELGFGVEQGAGFLTNSAGTLEVPAGTYGSVAGSTAVPVASTTMPAALSNAGFTPFSSTGAAAGAGASGAATGTIAGVSATTLGIGAATLVGIAAIVSGGSDDDAASSTTTTTTTSSNTGANTR